MAIRDLTLGMIFLSQTLTGTLGNFSLLCHYLFLCFTGCRLKTTDLVVEHLVIANCLVIFSRGIPFTMASFGWQHILTDFACKLCSYVHRVGRGVSFSTTCLLSVFQVVTISPRDSRWAELKLKASRYIGTSIFLCWILQMLINVIFPMYMYGNVSNKNMTSLKDFQYCSSVRHDKAADSLYAAFLSFPDIVCVGLMLWACSSMVSILYRHKQRMQHMRRTNVSPRSSPETRATKTILLLVSSFVCFYMLSFIIQVCLALIDNPSWFLVNAASIVDESFPILSPFLLMSRDSSVSTFCFAWIRNRTPP